MFAQASNCRTAWVIASAVAVSTGRPFGTDCLMPISPNSGAGDASKSSTLFAVTVHATASRDAAGVEAWALTDLAEPDPPSSPPTSAMIALAPIAMACHMFRVCLPTG